MYKGVEYVSAERRGVGFVSVRSLVPRVSVHFEQNGRESETVKRCPRSENVENVCGEVSFVLRRSRDERKKKREREKEEKKRVR